MGNGISRSRLISEEHVRLSLIIIMGLLLALGCYVVARYGFDAVAKQTLLESEFFFGRPSEPPSKAKYPPDVRVSGDPRP
jgi:hypothetical protein